MNHTTASCGHPTIAVGSPGSLARERCESQPCDGCKTKTYPQGCNLQCTETVSFKVGGKGRAITIKQGDYVWVQNSQVNQSINNVVTIGRPSQAMGHGYDLTREMIARYFKEMP